MPQILEPVVNLNDDDEGLIRHRPEELLVSDGLESFKIPLSLNLRQIKLDQGILKGDISLYC